MMESARCWIRRDDGIDEISDSTRCRIQRDDGSGVAMGCAGYAVHKGPQQSEGPLRVNLFRFIIA